MYQFSFQSVKDCGSTSLHRLSDTDQPTYQPTNLPITCRLLWTHSELLFAGSYIYSSANHKVCHFHCTFGWKTDYTLNCFIIILEVSSFRDFKSLKYYYPVRCVLDFFLGRHIKHINKLQISLKQMINQINPCHCLPVKEIMY